MFFLLVLTLLLTTIRAYYFKGSKLVTRENLIPLLFFLLSQF